MRIFPHRRRFVGRTQQPRLLQGGQVKRHPLVGVRRQHHQRLRSGRVGQDGRPQVQRLVGLASNELVAGEGRAGGRDVELERHISVLHIRQRIGPRLENLEQTGLNLIQIFGRLHQAAELGIQRLDPGHQGLKGAIQNLPQAGIGVCVEGQAGEVPSGEVQQVARGEDLTRQAIRVDRRIKAGEGDVLQRPVRRTPAEVRGERHVFQVHHQRIGPQFGDPEAEEGVRRVHIGQALQSHVVGAHVSRRQHARSSQANRHIRLDRSFNQVPIGDDRFGAVGIDHLQVVQAVGRVAEIENRHNLGGVDHLEPHRFEFGNPRPHQLDQRVLVELGAANGGGHIAAVPAGVGGDIRDLERHQFGQQRCRRVGGGLVLAADQQEVISRLGRGDHGHRFGQQGPFRPGIEQNPVRDVTEPHKQFIGRAGRVGLQTDPQGLAQAHPDLKQPVFAAAEREGQGHAQLQRVDGHVQRASRRRSIVRFPLLFKDLIEDVRADDDPVGAGSSRGEGRRQGRGVGLSRTVVPGLQRAAEPDASQGDVADVPQGVRREINGIGPAATGRKLALVADGPRDVDRIARLGRTGNHHVLDLQVGRRRQLDDQRDAAAGGIVVFVLALKHFPPRSVPAADRIGNHEDGERPRQVWRQVQGPHHLVAVPGGQAPLVPLESQEPIGRQIQKFVPRKIEQIVPRGLAQRGVTQADIGNGVAQLDRLPHQSPLGDRQLGHLEVRCGR